MIRLFTLWLSFLPSLTIAYSDWGEVEQSEVNAACKVLASETDLRKKQGTEPDVVIFYKTFELLGCDKVKDQTVMEYADFMKRRLSEETYQDTRVCLSRDGYEHCPSTKPTDYGSALSNSYGTGYRHRTAEEIMRKFLEYFSPPSSKTYHALDLDKNTIEFVLDEWTVQSSQSNSLPGAVIKQQTEKGDRFYPRKFDELQYYYEGYEEIR